MSSPSRALRRFTGSLTAVAVTLLGAPVVLASVAPSPSTRASADPVTLVSHHAQHPHRKIKKYVVRRGDTASGIATRFHAWTDELIAMNHSSVLHVGDVVRIPVVVKRARACTKHKDHFTGFYGHQHDKPKADKTKQHKPTKHRPKKHKPKATKPAKPKHHSQQHAHRHPKHGWVHTHADHREVRRIVAKRARYHGVNPDLALAVAWMESGWQQKRVSSAGALGVMQVMPGTGAWMSQVVGRALNLRNLHDNVTAGVVLLKLLRQEAGVKHAVAGYYQGLAGVRQHGMYRSTKHYVANVIALKRRLAMGWDPL